MSLSHVTLVYCSWDSSCHCRPRQPNPRASSSRNARTPPAGGTMATTPMSPVPSQKSPNQPRRYQEKETAAPLTEQELKERELRKDEIEHERKQTEEQKRRDELLLAAYGHEDDISYTRDRKLAQLEKIPSRQARKRSSRYVRCSRASETQASEESRGGKNRAAADCEKYRSDQDQIANHEAVVPEQNGRNREAVRKRGGNRS